MNYFNAIEYTRVRLKIHASVWIFYSLGTWLYNMFFRQETRFEQILGGLPVIVLIFYTGYFVTRYILARRRYCFGLFLGLMLVVFFILFGYAWVYFLMPQLGTNIYYNRPSNELSMYVEYGTQLIPKFLVYGAVLAVIDLYGLYPLLRGLVLAMQISPHHVRQVWSQLLHQVPIDDPVLLSHIKGEIQLSEYSARMPWFKKGLVTVEVEVHELERLIHRYQDRNIVYNVTGESKGQRILPCSILPLFTNALMYSDERFPIDISLDFTAGVEIIIRNQVASGNRTHHGLGTGLNNLKERLALIFGNSATLDIKFEDNTFVVKLIYKKRLK